MRLNRSRQRGRRFGSKGRSSWHTVLFVIIFCALGGLAYLFFHDLEGPAISITPDSLHVTPEQDIRLLLRDDASGVKSVSVVLRYSGDTQILFEKSFIEPAAVREVSFNLKDSKLKDGRFDLEITARDGSFAGLGRGNSTTVKRELVLDTHPPRITVRTSSPSVRRGSMTAFAYTLSEEVVSTGVQIGEFFFPAFQQENGLYYCFVAFPLDMKPEAFVPDVIARDAAGNTGRVRLRVRPVEPRYRSDKLNISENFLTQKALDFEEILPGGNLTPLERYIRINSEVRIENEAKLHELAAKTAPRMLWSGPFLRLPRSALRANYGDSRTYMYRGEVIDQQTHMGIDLASVAHAPIPAANDGQVIFADFLGIFGNLIIVDHGLGLMSLYSHMSEMLVKEGDVVTKGQIIARTGTTGLAGGDHLHFGMLVNGFQVQPVDWLDKNWINNMITSRLSEAAAR